MKKIKKTKKTKKAKKAKKAKKDRYADNPVFPDISRLDGVSIETAFQITKRICRIYGYLTAHERHVAARKYWDYAERLFVYLDTRGWKPSRGCVEDEGYL